LLQMKCWIWTKLICLSYADISSRWMGWKIYIYIYVCVYFIRAKKFSNKNCIHTHQHYTHPPHTPHYTHPSNTPHYTHYTKTLITHTTLHTPIILTHIPHYTHYTHPTHITLHNPTHTTLHTPNTHPSHTPLTPHTLPVNCRSTQTVQVLKGG
jgi:hypothetical protein